MELKRLKYFVTAAHELNFSAAARKLGVSQPALSRGIKELETYIGARLFDRSPTEVSLTKAGQTFLSEADEALLTLEQAIRSVRRAAKRTESALSISYHPALLDPVLGPAMSIFRQTFNNISFQLREVQTQREATDLKGGEIDISFHCYHEEDDFGSEFDMFDIGSVNNCAIISSDHPLARADSVTLEELSALDFITFPSTDFPLYVRAIKRHFDAQGIDYSPLMEANSPHCMISSVIAGDCFAIMTFLATTISPRSVAFVPLAEANRMPMKFGALVKRGENRNLVRAFLQECKRVAGVKVPQLLSEYTAERMNFARPAAQI